MNVLGRAAQGYIPECVRTRALRRLFKDTAAALRRPVPPLGGLRSQQVLASYAAFTASATRDADTDDEVFSNELFRSAKAYGAALRRLFGVTTTTDVVSAARVVYRLLDIDFDGNVHGEIVISRCFFSAAYTPETCQLMSALDDGLLAGLSDGGRLTFSQRITEGHACCRARLHLSQEAS